MALDFPSNPTDGQIYGNYQWSSSSGAWKSTPSQKTVSVVSATAPTSANAGDIWIDSTDGTSFYYYDDGNTKQWVELMASGIPSTPVSVASGGTGATTIAGAQTNLQVPLSANYVINGAFDIWQRYTAPTAVTTAATRYVADRWETYRSSWVSGLTVSRQPTGLTGFQYCMRVQRVAADTSTNNIYASQPFETVNSIPLAGQTVTFSFYARAGANYSSASNILTARIATGLGTDQSLSNGFTGVANEIVGTPTLTTSWQRFSYTGTLSLSLNQVGINFYYTPVGTAGSGDYFEITGVQLEIGSTATPFRRNANSLQGELAACQRYYYRWNGTLLGDGFANISFWTANRGWGTYNLPVQMRTTPTALAVTTNKWQVLVSNANVDVSSFGFATTNVNTLTLDITVASGGTLNASGTVRNHTTSGTGYVEVSAEL